MEIIKLGILYFFSLHNIFRVKLSLPATYLINSKVLNFETPFDVFHKFFPTNRLSSSLPLKIFGCSSFAHIHSQNRGKLEPRATKCLFVGYAPTQK